VGELGHEGLREWKLKVGMEVNLTKINFRVNVARARFQIGELSKIMKSLR
tara:strand:+ start:310 stop:459 length:150 start_codon:yes stop_codon:yes gene_type:complete